MSDKPEDKTPEAIKKHQMKLTLEMKGPRGSAVREDMANYTVAKDQARFSGNRAEKYAKMEKQKIARTVDMENGTKGIASKEFNKDNNKDLER